jgi:DNA-binding HxlR family transcriptional regulator
MKTAYTTSQIQRTKQLARTIGDEHNLLIFYELMNFGEKSFNELSRMTDINAVTLSKKLSLLKADGWVDSKKSGKENLYRLTNKSEELRPLITTIRNLITK